MNIHRSSSYSTLQEVTVHAHEPKVRIDNDLSLQNREDHSTTRQHSSTINSIDSLNISSIENKKTFNSTLSTPVKELDPNPESPTYLLSEALNGFSSIKDRNEFTVVSRGNDLIILLTQYPNLKNDILLKSFINKINFMFYDEVSEVRAVGYKLLRYVISNLESLTILVQSKILIFIIITLSTSSSSLIEKEQALKLIRQFLVIPNGCDNLSIGVIKSLICIIETDNHQINLGFKEICLETICEISLLKPELIFHSGGFNLIIDTVINGSIEMSTLCLMTLIKTLDEKESRKFIRNGYDLNSITSVFSNTEDFKKLSVIKLQRIAFLVTMILKNFNGLMSFSIDGFRVIRDFLLNLKKKNFKLRDCILDIIMDVLRIKVLPFLANSLIGELIKGFNKLHKDNSDFLFTYDKMEEDSLENNLVNHYLGLITSIFIQNGLATLLIEIIEDNLDESNTTKATILITHVYKMANNILPPEIVNDNTLLPTHIKNHLAISSIFRIENLIKNESIPRPVNSNLKDYLKKLTIEARCDIDDLEFKNLVNNTKVLAIKEFEEWNWNLLQIVIQGPLRSPKRFDEVLEKNPKFLKRLMSFYRPFKFRFASVPSSNNHSEKYISIGCQLLETFLSLENGIKYLSTNKLLPQISEVFAQVDPYSGLQAKDAILSKHKLESTTSKGYFKLVKVLTSNVYGLKMLEQWQFFNIFHNIIEASFISQSKNYLISYLLQNMDYSKDSQPRILLAKAMSMSNLSVKEFIFDHIISDLLQRKECEYFIIKLLANQLYDPNIEILQRCVHILKVFITSNNLDMMGYFISLKPSTQILSRSIEGRELLLYCMQNADAFKYLEASGFIGREFEKWVGNTDFSYFEMISSSLHLKFFPYMIYKSSNIGALTGVKREEHEASLKFFRYLLSTEEGLNYLSEPSKWKYLRTILNEIFSLSSKLSSSDNYYESLLLESKKELVTKVQQNLCIIGCIGTSKYGIQLLDPIFNINLTQPIFPVIIDLFYNSSVWQLRSTCFFVLGMLASTVEGMEILDELNWTSVIDAYSNPKALTYPNSPINDIFNVPIANPYSEIKYYSIFNGTSNNMELLDEMYNMEVVNYEMINDKVLYLINHLNSVLGKVERKATKELMKIKETNPGIFGNLKLFLEVIKVIDKGSYKFYNRNFVFGLFLDTKVLENIIKKDRKNSFKT